MNMFRLLALAASLALASVATTPTAQACKDCACKGAGKKCAHKGKCDCKDNAGKECKGKCAGEGGGTEKK